MPSIGIGIGVDRRRIAPLWTPSGATLPGLTAWWDASDLSTITAAAASVSQWDDKSGNGYHLVQGTEASQPVTGTRTINGLDALDFDGAASSMEIASGPQPASNDVTILALIDSDLSSAYNGSLLRWEGTGDNLRLGFDAAGGSRFSCNSTTYSPVAAPYQAGAKLLGAYRSGATIGIGYDGSYATAATGTALGTLSIWALARRGALFFDGSIGEVLVALPGAWSQADIQKAEGYLAHKWGITLAAGHPYRNFPPRL